VDLQLGVQKAREHAGQRAGQRPGQQTEKRMARFCEHRGAGHAGHKAAIHSKIRKIEDTEGDEQTQRHDRKDAAQLHASYQC